MKRWPSTASIVVKMLSRLSLNLDMHNNCRLKLILFPDLGTIFIVGGSNTTGYGYQYQYDVEVIDLLKTDASCEEIPDFFEASIFYDCQYC